MIMLLEHLYIYHFIMIKVDGKKMTPLNWSVTIWNFSFQLSNVKKGDVFGFGIHGDWDSEYNAGPHCRLYFTHNGTEVWLNTQSNYLHG